MFHGPQHGTPAAVYINQFWMVRTHVSLATKCHKKGKTRGPTGTGTQSLSLSVRQLSNWAIWPTSDIFPCLNIFVPANLLGTTEEQTRHAFLMLVVPAVTPHWATICHRRGKIVIVIRPGFEPMATAYRASTVPTELPSHLVDPALLDSSSNPLGTRHVVFDARSPSRQPTMSHQMSRRGGGGGVVVRSGLEPRASRYPWDNWGVEPYGRPLTFGCEEYTKEMKKKGKINRLGLIESVDDN